MKRQHENCYDFFTSNNNFLRFCQKLFDLDHITFFSKIKTILAKQLCFQSIKNEKEFAKTCIEINRVP